MPKTLDYLDIRPGSTDISALRPARRFSASGPAAAVLPLRPSRRLPPATPDRAWPGFARRGRSADARNSGSATQVAGSYSSTDRGRPAWSIRLARDTSSAGSRIPELPAAELSEACRHRLDQHRMPDGSACRARPHRRRCVVCGAKRHIVDLANASARCSAPRGCLETPCAPPRRLLLTFSGHKRTTAQISVESSRRSRPRGRGESRRPRGRALLTRGGGQAQRVERHPAP